MTTDFKIARIRYTWKGNWAPAYEYVKDDVVAYGGKTYVCFDTHTSAGTFAPDLTASTWVLMLDGYAWKNNWTISTAYNPGDIVRYSGIVYRCLTTHTSNSSTSTGIGGTDTTSGLEADQTKWEIVAKAENWTQDWTVSTRYRINDLVKYGATVYRCITSHNSVDSTASGLEADSIYWEVVYQQSDYKNYWATSTRYKVNDVAKYGGSLWKCTGEHTATTFAANLGNWIIYLDGMQFESGGWSTETLYQRGDVVTYGGYSYRALQNNSGQSPFNNLAYWSIVSENYNFKGDWVGGVTPTDYRVGDVVRLNGYLYTAVADNTLQEPPNPTYWKVVNQGKKWKGPWLASSDYKLGDIVAVGPSTFECIAAHGSVFGNRPDVDVGGGSTGTYWTIYVQGTTTNVMTTPADMVYYNAGAKTRLAAGTSGQVLKVSATSPVWGLWGAISKVYYVAPGGTDVNTNGQGTTLDTPFATIKYACSVVTGPATIYVKSGIYSEILPITVPASVALVGDELRTATVQPAAGFETANMFYVRDGSGIRNMTLQGLSGTLGLANIYGTQRPTAGAYVSLDPTGIGNPQAQILYRSPYIQNVTTLGTGCIGLKVDGSLHSAGNKSIVANDFTHVIDNGIGVWVTNGGRSELVSVFTYYAHIGYLAENGGKIRATNGNNSYGKFGAVSEGTLSTETAVTGTINNRGGPAVIGFVFTDGTKILGFEYDNAGISYNSATTFSFTGSGLNAAASTANVRDGGVYEVRLTDPTSSGSYGGGGYLNVVNNAQAGSGAAGTIYLSAGDSNVQSNYLGMRVMIISGKAAGQYGYISSYSSSTKLATILKESDGTAGWDAVQSVNSIVDLDTTSQYSIEPRVTFSAPISGTRAQARIIIASGRIAKFRLFEPGSGYVTAPTLTIGDPNGSGVTYEIRIGNGVLATPSFSNRGTGYLTASAVVASGTGYQDAYQYGSYLYISGLASVPTPGANVNFPSSSTNFRLVTADTITGTGPYSARFSIYPALPLAEAPPQGQGVSVRTGYSQNRLTGHDFLEIGTGTKTETNYPNVDVSTIKPQYLAVENGGGRVFYTATDQDGNFRVGSLFKVEQASGTATLNASFFQLNGLSQLTLGGIVLGGTSATITEISTDATLPANSDGVLVTQRAIKSYIASRIGGGGSSLNVNEMTAGQIKIATTNQITNTLSSAINFKNKVNFTGGVDGSMAATAFFISGGRS